MSQGFTDQHPSPEALHAPAHAAYALDRIQDALRGLRFGEVTVVVQDGVVVQVERTEKLRLARR